MELELTVVLILLLTGFAAGLIDAIAGGGGMIALPVLLACGLSPVEALATNKLQGSFGTFSAARYFVKNGWSICNRCGFRFSAPSLVLWRVRF